MGVQGDESDDLLTMNEIDVAEGTIVGMTLREIAAKVGMSHTGVQRVLSRPRVAAYVRQALTERADRVRALIANAAPKAVRVLIEIAEDDKAPHAARVSAASKLIDSTLPRQHRHAGPEGGPMQVMDVTAIEAAAAAAAARLSDDALGLTDADD